MWASTLAAAKKILLRITVSKDILIARSLRENPLPFLHISYVTESVVHTCKDNQQQAQTQLITIQDVEVGINNQVIEILEDMQFHAEQLSTINDRMKKH